jgi:hypothetical protein
LADCGDLAIARQRNAECLGFDRARGKSGLNKRVFGLVLIALGVSVWVVYAALRMTGVSVNGGLALAIHLFFVIPGAILAPGDNLYSRLTQRVRRDKSSEESQ